MFELNDSLISSLSEIDNSFQHRKKDFYNSISTKNALINKWLGEEYSKLYPTDLPACADIFAPSFSQYAKLYIEQMNLDNIIFYDYDPEVVKVNWQCLKLVKKDRLIDQKCLDVILDTDYTRRNHLDVIINFSCEKMVDMKFIVERVYEGKNPVFCFISTDKHDRGNINVYSNLASFEKSTGLSTIKYSGELKFKNNNETKYLVIGEK